MQLASLVEQAVQPTKPVERRGTKRLHRTPIHLQDEFLNSDDIGQNAECDGKGAARRMLFFDPISSQFY